MWIYLYFAQFYRPQPILTKLVRLKILEVDLIVNVNHCISLERGRLFPYDNVIFKALNFQILDQTFPDFVRGGLISKTF